MTYITHVRMSPENANDHDHITHVKWEQHGKTGVSTRQEMVDFIRQRNRVFVHGRPDAEVGVVDANPPHLRTHADGMWSNNLLSLPRF